MLCWGTLDLVSPSWIREDVNRAKLGVMISASSRLWYWYRYCHFTEIYFSTSSVLHLFPSCHAFQPSHTTFLRYCVSCVLIRWVYVIAFCRYLLVYGWWACDETIQLQHTKYTGSTNHKKSDFFASSPIFCGAFAEIVDLLSITVSFSLISSLQDELGYHCTLLAVSRFNLFKLFTTPW